MYGSENLNGTNWTMILVFGSIGIIGFVASLMAIFPIYSVWAAHKSGQADLARARNEQQVQVAQAQGRLDAAELNKKAQVVEAEAISASVEKIGKALHNNAGYLQWQWIRMMEEQESGNVIYVPTEAGLPILEAGNRSRKVKEVEEN